MDRPACFTIPRPHLPPLSPVSDRTPNIPNETYPHFQLLVPSPFPSSLGSRQAIIPSQSRPLPRSRQPYTGTSGPQRACGPPLIPTFTLWPDALANWFLCPSLILAHLVRVLNPLHLAIPGPPPALSAHHRRLCHLLAVCRRPNLRTMGEFIEFYVTCNPPLRPNGVKYVLDQLKESKIEASSNCPTTLPIVSLRSHLPIVR